MKWALLFYFLLVSCKVVKCQNKPDIQAFLKMGLTDKKFHTFYSQRIIYFLENSYIRKDSKEISLKGKTVKIITYADTAKIREYLWLNELLTVKNNARLMITNLKTNKDFNLAFIKENGQWKIRESIIIDN
jgi:hypothetical protein